MGDSLQSRVLDAIKRAVTTRFTPFYHGLYHVNYKMAGPATGQGFPMSIVSIYRDCVMSTSSSFIPSLAMMLALVGCGTSGERVPAIRTSPATQPFADRWHESLPRHDDPGVSPARRRAIRVATAALHGPDPAPQLLDELRFNISETQAAFWVQVWRVEPGKVTPPGNFTSVEVGRDFRVIRIVGDWRPLRGHNPMQRAATT